MSLAHWDLGSLANAVESFVRLLMVLSWMNSQAEVLPAMLIYNLRYFPFIMRLASQPTLAHLEKNDNNKEFFNSSVFEAQGHPIYVFCMTFIIKVVELGKNRCPRETMSHI